MVALMDMLTDGQITAAGLADWRKLGQGLHARYLVDDFATGARFTAAMGGTGDGLSHHLRVTMGQGYVDLKLISDDAVYRDDQGEEHPVEWVTQKDVDLARGITEIAAEQAIMGRPRVDHHDRVRRRHRAYRHDRPGLGSAADREHGGEGPRDDRR